MGGLFICSYETLRSLSVEATREKAFEIYVS